MDWHEVTVADQLVFSSPVELRTAEGQGIDTVAGEWRGDDLIVRIDAGPFVDPLNRYANKPDYESFDIAIDGRPAKGVSFDQADGSRFTAVFVPDVGKTGSKANRLTFVVITSGKRTAAEARRILKSIRLKA